MKKKNIIITTLIILSLLILSIQFKTPSIEKYETSLVKIDHQFLTINPYSRSGQPLKHINGIVIHYTANPGSSAKNNRDYFENLKKTKETKASSHFIIGIKGEVIQCIPLNEIAYASNSRNKDTISIECCHPDSSGKFTSETINSLTELVRSLQTVYKIPKTQVLRHYDITHKNCPKYYVQNEWAWQQFKSFLD